MPEPLSADDRLAIIDRLAQYAYAMDSGDAAAFIAHFTPEPDLDIGYRKVTGAAELAEFAAYYAQKPGRPWYHHITTISVAGDAQRAQSRSYLLMTERDPEGGTRINGTATYLDDFVKVDGRWLCEKHVVLT